MSDRDKPAYTCPSCGAESWSEQDAIHRYCGRCHAFEDPLLAGRELRVATQLHEWVKGNPMHNAADGECCPDFACCNAKVDTPRETRERFAKAHREGDEQMQMQMLGMFLGAGLADVIGKKQVHIAGDPEGLQ